MAVQIVTAFILRTTQNFSKHIRTRLLQALNVIAVMRPLTRRNRLLLWTSQPTSVSSAIVSLRSLLKHRKRMRRLPTEIVSLVTARMPVSTSV